VSALGDGALALAGGTELVPLMREGLVRVEELVHVADVVPRGIAAVEPTQPSNTVLQGSTGAGMSAAEPKTAPDGSSDTVLRALRIGAGTTLAELEVDPQIPDALREACRLAASPQLRAMGTIGGNLRQATRCWYWRLAFPCRLHGGDRCHARDGEHGEHAIFANGFCASAHPSDPAAALLALGATVRTDRRELPVTELYRLPTEADHDVVALERDELILELDVPQPDASVYLKAMDRRRWAFPLVGVAAARAGADTRLALAGVAPVPWSLAGEAALEEATPLRGTAYKLELARALVRRASAAVAAR
jgi:xanthine dehydrogenase YagS FAD-binding subunit